MDFKKFLPHIIAVLALGILNAIYFYPAYQGKTLEQDDIKLGVAKTKELRDYRENTGDQALWTNAMFGGMPTFQMNLKHPGNWFEKIEAATKLWQPAQVGLILFLMIGFYILMMSYKTDPWVAAIGALAFGFSAFFIISFDAGHNAKIRAAGYIAPMLMGILLTFRKKYWLGLAFTALFAGLAINANHIQITYYSVLLAVIIAIVELVNVAKTSKLPSYFRSIGVLLIAGILALGPNVSQLWTTYEYQKETIRGGGTGLEDPTKDQGSGLDRDYAMTWSYSAVETLNLIIPDITGGGASQDYSETETYDRLLPNIRANLQQQGYSGKAAENQAKRQVASLFYWGDQSLVNGGYYLGASIFFFFVLAMFVIRDRRRIWIVAGVVLAVLMAWGKNLAWFNDLLFDYLPLYNKFRVPSMTFVLVFLLMPLAGMLGLDYVIKNYQTEKAHIKKSVLYSFYITGGFFLLMALLGPSLFSFESDVRDAQFAQNPQLLDLLIEDRQNIARSSAFRSFIYSGLAFLAVFLFTRNTIKKPILLVAISVLVLADLWSFDKQHLNEESFVKTSAYQASFNPTAADQSIVKDKSIYRVFNLQNPFNDAITSYYHKSVGGYHGAKLQRYQELYENVLFQEQNLIVQNLRKNQGQNIQQIFSNTPVLNMLNGKYVIYNPQAPALQNPNANGNAWFAKRLEVKNSGREILDALKTANSKQVAFIDEKFADYASPKLFSQDGSINLTNYDPNEMTYESSSTTEQFAVFSEIYYGGETGDWQAYIDGEPAEHIRVNYVLRAMKIPAGNHEIKFEFKPQSYFAGTQISMIFSIILLLVFIGAVYMDYRKNKKISSESTP